MKRIVCCALILTPSFAGLLLFLSGWSADPASIPLSLMGTVVGDPERPLAVIRDLEGNIAQLYGIGDRLPHGFRLTEVDADRIKVRGADEAESTLRLEAVKNRKGKKALRVAHFFDGKPMLMEVDEPSIVERLIRGDFRFSFRAKEFSGFGIEGTPFEKIFYALDLKDGDEFLEVNEARLRSFRHAKRLLEGALRQLPITVTIYKKSQRQVFTYFLGRASMPVPRLPTTEPGYPSSIDGSATGVPGAREGERRPQEPFAGPLMVLGIVAGHAPRTMEVQLQANLNSPVLSLQIRPCQDAQGRFSGLELSEAYPPEEAERVGIRVGDRIIAIDGVRLVGLLQTLGVVRKAFRQASVQAEMSRGSETTVRTLEPRF